VSPAVGEDDHFLFHIHINQSKSVEKQNLLRDFTLNFWVRRAPQLLGRSPCAPQKICEVDEKNVKDVTRHENVTLKFKYFLRR
jgi:hypothetical protein